MHREKAWWEWHKNVALNKCWKQNPTKQQLYSHLPPISQTIQTKQNMQGTAREVRINLSTMFSMDSYSWVCQCWLTLRDTGCSLEDLPRAIDERNGWQESQGILCCQYDLIMMTIPLSIQQSSGFEFAFFNLVSYTLWSE